MTTPPALSTLSAVTELFVSVAVFWFFYHAARSGNHRWGVVWTAIAYETLFNITYMVWRLWTHEEDVTHAHPGWVTWFVGVHGALSLGMFVGLIAFVAWAGRRVRAGEPDPIRRRPGWTLTFLALWTASVLSGELIYVFYWTGIIRS